MEHLRTVNKDRFTQLRDELELDDQTLLTLRVDRDLSWNEVARILSDDEIDDEDALTRASARLRQRFKKLKEHLRERAKATGLIPTDA
jgi:RNA polymerase sigma-70 factor (ECF subfamily)